MNQPASATVRQKQKSSVPLNNKREDEIIQRLALDLQNSSQHNCSVNKTSSYKTSISCNLNEQMLQHNFFQKKEQIEWQMKPRQFHIVTETVVTIPCILTTIKVQLLKPFQTLNFQKISVNSGKFLSAMLLPTVPQTNVSQQFQNPHYPTGVHLAMEIELKNQTMEFFPLQYNTQQPTYQLCLLYIITSTQLSVYYGKFIYKLPNSHSSPIAQPISQPNVSGNSKQIPNGSFPGKQLFQPRTEIQTETIPFENSFSLQTTNKNSIELPAITILNFNGNPLKYHEWINYFSNLVHNKTSLKDTHRITYLQNSVVEKAKEIIQAYSCDTAYYAIALKELMDHFVASIIVVKDFINKLEAWAPVNDYKIRILYLCFYSQTVSASFWIFRLQRWLAKFNIDKKGNFT